MKEDIKEDMTLVIKKRKIKRCIIIGLLVIFIFWFLIWMISWHEVEHSLISMSEGNYIEGAKDKVRDTTKMFDVDDSRAIYFYSIKLVEGNIEIKLIDSDTGEQIYRKRYNDAGEYEEEIQLDKHARIESYWYSPNTNKTECYIKDGLRWHKKKGYRIFVDNLKKII